MPETRRAVQLKNLLGQRLPTGSRRFFFQDHAAQFGNLVGRILQVGIHRDDDLAFGCGETAVQGCRLAVIAGEANAADRRVLLPERFDNLPGAV